MERRKQGISHLVLESCCWLACWWGCGRPQPWRSGRKPRTSRSPARLGTEISLRQFQGKQFVLIEFYGADFSPV